MINGLAMTKTLVNYFHGSWCWLQARMENYYENTGSGIASEGENILAKTDLIFVFHGDAGKRHGRLLRVIKALEMTEMLTSYLPGPIIPRFRADFED